MVPSLASYLVKTGSSEHFRKTVEAVRRGASLKLRYLQPTGQPPRRVYDTSAPCAQQVAPGTVQSRWAVAGMEQPAWQQRGAWQYHVFWSPHGFAFPSQPATPKLSVCRGAGSDSVCCPQELVLNITAGTPQLSVPAAAKRSQQAGFRPVKLQSRDTVEFCALKSLGLLYLQAPESPSSKTNNRFSPKLW